MHTTSACASGSAGRADRAYCFPAFRKPSRPFTSSKQALRRGTGLGNDGGTTKPHRHVNCSNNNSSRDTSVDKPSQHERLESTKPDQVSSVQAPHDPARRAHLSAGETANGQEAAGHTPESQHTAMPAVTSLADGVQGFPAQPSSVLNPAGPSVRVATPAITGPSDQPLPRKAHNHVELDASDLELEARRYLIVSLAQFSMGSVLVVAPDHYMTAALNSIPTALEVCFARLMGVALLFRGLLALVLKSASNRGRLHSTSAQRVMLGCILPGINHMIAFKTIYSQWGVQWNWGLMFLYPSVLGAELYTHLAAFQVYNPYFLAKLLWPVCVALLTAQLMPPMPSGGQVVEKLKAVIPATVLVKLTPVAAGTAMLLSRRGIGLLVKGAIWMAKVVQRYKRGKAVGRAFTKILPEAGMPLTGTVVRMMDFLLPSSALAWGYWFMMLQHFATMFNAYMPDMLFTGAVSPISSIMKQSWSAGFLAAAFASDALKTAADRQHLEMPENRQLNLCLAMLEAGYAACLAIGMAQGVVVVNTYSHLRLTTALASVAFCMGVWWMSVREAERKGWPQQPSVSSYDWQEQTEQRPEYAKVTSMAVVALNIITCAIG